MKKICLLIILLLIPSALAISTDMKESYEQGETMIVEIIGNILQPIEKDDVELFRGHVQVPIDYDVKRIGQKYYFYGIAPQNENNYSLKINNLLTTIDGVTQEIDFIQNFSTTAESVDYSIKPGFAIFEDEFEFTINLNRDLEETISIDFPEETDIILNSGENKIEITSIENETGFRIIQIGKYSVPVFILELPPEPKVSTTNLKIFPKRIESILLYGQTKSYPISITNEGDSEITDLVLNYNSDVFDVEPISIPIIEPNETVSFNLSLKTQDEPISEILTLESDYFYEKIELNISYTENINETETPYLEENYSETQGYYCSELGGDSCSADEECSSETVPTIDVNNCCLETCSTFEDKSLAWLGFVIGLIILIVLIVVGIRYKKSKEKPSALKKQVTQAKKANPIFSKKP